MNLLIMGIKGIVEKTMNIGLHWALPHFLVKNGCGSKLVTAKILKCADEYVPNMLWMHNNYGYYHERDFVFPVQYTWQSAMNDLEAFV